MSDSVDRLASGTGLTRAAVLDVWAAVRANRALLLECPRHAFVLLPQAAGTLARWRCSACSGEVDGSAAGWYRLGLEHGGS